MKTIGIWLFGFLFTIVGLLAFGLSIMAFIAAYADAYHHHQCPNGNNCEDALMAMKIMPIISIASTFVFAAGIFAMRKSLQHQNSALQKDA